MTISKHREGFSLALRFLVVVGFIQLNIQKIIYVALGIEIESGASHPILMFWMVVPLTLWVAGIWTIIRRRTLTRPELVLWGWAMILIAHGFLFSLLYGIIAGLVGFLSWGTWIGLFLVGNRDTQHDLSGYFAWIFILGGCINTASVFYDLLSGTVFKFVTVGNVHRVYGMSQSVSILGLQLAIGCISTLYVLINQRGWSRSLAIPLFCIQFMALVITSSRGPMVFFLFSLFFMMFALRLSLTKKFIMMVSFLGVGISVYVYFSQQEYVSFLLDSLTLSDEGNIARLKLYEEAWNMFINKWYTIFIGFGSGRLSQMAPYIGEEEFGVESSLIKLVMEFGFLGVPLIVLFIVSVIRSGTRLLHTKQNPKIVPFLAIALILVLESTFHESLKSWIIAFYLWATLTVIACQINAYKKGIRIVDHRI